MSLFGSLVEKLVPTNYDKFGFEELLRMANEGDAEAQARLGDRCLDGQGVAQNHAEALKWYQMAAGRGHARAANNLGGLYEKGYGVPQDDAEAARHYRTAADGGFALAQYNLGRLYAKGQGVPRDCAAAAEWYQKAARQKYAPAQLELGRLYEAGQGLPRDEARAAECYRAAAAQGNAQAQANLGILHLEGRGVPGDEAKGWEWLQKAARQNNAEAQYRLGNRCGWAGNQAEAAEWYRKAGAQGHADAQATLGVLYRDGIGVQQDFAESVKWFRMAADQGHLWGMTNLATAYQYGEGVEQDFDKAAQLYRHPAEQGLAEAQNHLGVLYFQGNGVPRDLVKAVELYQKAADQGHLWGITNLANKYRFGEGVPQNYEKAAELYRQAAERGIDEAQNALGMLYDEGKGVPQNHEMAFEWLSQAAKQGHPGALFNIAKRNYEGIGVPQNFEIAAQFFQFATDKGHPEAPKRLGIMYRDGLGVPKDPEKARELFGKAAALGDAEAKRFMASVGGGTANANPDGMQAALADLIGLQSVKEELEKIRQYISFELKRARDLGGGAAPVAKTRNNFIFTGNPGTGKTTVAKLLADILHRAGAIRENKLIEADRSRLVSQWVGDTPIKTTKVVESALGGVLFIDEAYALVQGDQDNVGREALDTLVKLIEDHKDDLSVILAGYAKETEELMRKNPGLKSRFNRTIDFPDYSPEELFAIAERIAGRQRYSFSEGGARAFREIIGRERVKPGFANARTVSTVVQSAFERHALNAGKQGANQDYLTTLTEADFGVDFSQRGGQALEDLRRQLDELIGLQGVKAAVRKMVAKLEYMRKEEEKAGRPLGLGKERLHLCFTGNPGTGKTTVARLYARILKELGFLAQGHMVETNRSDLVAGYMGQTAEKTRKVCESAYGGILFVDEAYSLCNGERDEFGMEAVNELITQMENNRDRLVVILAGYRREMEEFFNVNSGIKSRISQTVEFADYNADELRQIFGLAMKHDTPPLSADEAASRLIQERISAMHAGRDANFGNAREMEKLFAAIKDNMILRVTEGNLEGAARYLITREDVEAAQL